MQQTETYKLNLIERTDAFSPDVLNENAEKLERQLALLDGADTALDSRVTALELKKIAFGTYTGNAQKTDDTQFIPLDFTPAAVIVGVEIALRDQPAKDMVIEGNGFTVIANMYSTLNQPKVVYNFVAFG